MKRNGNINVWNCVIINKEFFSKHLIFTNEQVWRNFPDNWNDGIINSIKKRSKVSSVSVYQWFREEVKKKMKFEMLSILIYNKGYLWEIAI